MPWDAVAVDLIGPWKISVSGIELEFLALTCIDPVTNITELIRIESKTAAHVAQNFTNVWLSRYPISQIHVFMTKVENSLELGSYNC